MAIHEQPRENLLRDATAYFRRMLIRPHNLRCQSADVTELFVGLRPDGRWSLYFDESPVIQFDGVGQLRRLYIYPDRYAASKSRLIKLVRESRGGRVRMSRHELDSTTHDEIMNALRDLLRNAVECVSRIASESDRDCQSPQIVHYWPSDDRSLATECESFLRQTVDNLRIAPDT